jgi:hypothetical protein
MSYDMLLQPQGAGTGISNLGGSINPGYAGFRQLGMENPAAVGGVTSPIGSDPLGAAGPATPGTNWGAILQGAAALANQPQAAPPAGVMPQADRRINGIQRIGVQAPQALDNTRSLAALLGVR